MESGKHRTVHLLVVNLYNIYSCKFFDIVAKIYYMNSFWSISKYLKCLIPIDNEL